MRSLPLAAVAALASAANLTVQVPPSQHLPNPSTLPPSTHAILLGPPGFRYDAPIRRDNTFLFTDLPSASYLLTLHSRDYFFAPLRVDVSDQSVAATASASEDVSLQTIEAWQTFRGIEWSNKGPSYGAGKGGLTIAVRAAAPKDFYQVRGGFSLMSFFKNPMILMGLFSVVMIFGMPYIMENMDAETKAEFEEISSKSPLTSANGPANALQNFDLASWMAGSSKTAETPTGGGGKKK